MRNFVMYCKTYRNDLEPATRMISSFKAYNRNEIEMFLSVPEDDLPIFELLKTKNVHVISDECYAGKYLINEELHGRRVGYINQQICKLSFWEMGVASNYLCIDSDVEFIRNFYVSDFMVDDHTPYTILIMDKDLSVEKHYRKAWAWRQPMVKLVYDHVGLKDDRLRTCHGMQVLNHEVLNSLRKDFMDPQHLHYKDLMAISPLEFTWYNAWFQKCGLVAEYAVESPFKTFHMRIDYTFSRFKLIRREDLSKSFVGIIFNSNWTNGKLLTYKDPSWAHKLIYNAMLKHI